MRGSSYTAAFWECTDCSETLKGFRNGVSIFLSTGYCIGSIIAIILNLILPCDSEDIVPDGDDAHWSMIGEKTGVDEAEKNPIEDPVDAAKKEDEETGEVAKAETSSEEDGIIPEQAEATT